MTASTIIGLITALLSIIKLVAQYATSNQLLSAGAAEEILRGIKNAQDAVDKANAARELVRANSLRDPSSVMSDDGYRRD